MSTCRDACAENWPSLLVEDGAPLAGEGVDAELLDVIEREDGGRQVTYGGWSLYTFARDEAPGDVVGQGRGDVWFLVTPAGDPLGAPADATMPEGALDVDALMAQGELVFASSCAVCHGAEGGGDQGARLVGHGRLDATSHLIGLVRNGIRYMAAIGMDFSEEQVAAHLTNVWDSWGNDAGAVTVMEVEAVR